MRMSNLTDEYYELGKFDKSVRLHLETCGTTF